jgi:hypothetical protein
MYSDNITQKVAAVAAQILSGQKPVEEELKGNQKTLDKNHNNKLDSQDFKILRGEKKAIKEEDAYDKDRYAVKDGKAVKDNPAHMGSKDEPHHVWAKSADEALKKKMNKEEVEQINEGIEDRLEAARAKAKAAGKPIKDKPAAPKSNVRKIEGSAYGGAKQKDEPEADEDDTPAKKTVKYGARQNYKRSTRVNESFTEMLSRYDQEGLKFVADTLVVEEPTEEEFNAEIKKAQDKSEGKDKAEVAKASVQAVKNEEVEVIDADEINGVDEVTIDERHMTDSEMNKREKIVKSMKKGLSGFKQRYGDKAKNVMYATATKQAMKD